MEQFSSLIEFRQAGYDNGLTLAKDAQFELVDALLLSPYVHSSPELSLSPAFRRKWPGAYAAIDQSSQDQAWLESYFAEQIPESGPQVFPWMTRRGLIRRPGCWPIANTSVGPHQE